MGLSFHFSGRLSKANIEKVKCYGCGTAQRYAIEKMPQELRVQAIKNKKK